MSIKTARNKSRGEKSPLQDDKPPRIDFEDAIKIMLDTKPLPKKKLAVIKSHSPKSKTK